MNYTELCAAISETTENSYTADQLALFTRLAEQAIYNSCTLSTLRKNVTGTLTNGVAYLSAPDDFLSPYSMAVVDLDGNYSYLLNKDVNFIREAYPSTSGRGLPKHYAIFGPRSDDHNELSFMVGPTPDENYVVELHYFFYPESIVTAGTSWLGDNFESALLNGCLVEAARFMKAEQDIVALYQQMFTQSIALLKNLSDGKQRGDTYRNGQTRVRVN